MQIQPRTETWIEHHMLITSENMLFASETAVLCNLRLHPSLPLGLLQLHKDLLYVKEKGLRERMGLHNARQSSFSSLSHPFPVYRLSRVPLRHGPRLLSSTCMKRLHIYSSAFLHFAVTSLRLHSWGFMKVPLGFHSQLAVVLAVDDVQRWRAGAEESLIFRGKVNMLLLEIPLFQMLTS